MPSFTRRTLLDAVAGATTASLGSSSAFADTISSLTALEASAATRIALEGLG